MSPNQTRVSLREIGESVLSLLLGLVFLASLAVVALMLETVK